MLNYANYVNLGQMQGVVNFFGRIAMLIDQNTQAFHMFMSALLQVLLHLLELNLFHSELEHVASSLFFILDSLCMYPKRGVTYSVGT